MNNYDIKCKIIEEELKSVWPEWHVAGHLGGGAFGDVYHIYKENYGIRVDSALKVIQVSSDMPTAPLPLNDPDATEEDTAGESDIPAPLRSEIQIMETLRGAPNIVNIEDFHFKRVGMTSSLFVRMELLTSLNEVLFGRERRYTLSTIQEIRKLGKDICTALMHCEKKGIIHRDIKPSNLFVDEYGHFKVGDFGASKRMDTVHSAHTMTGIGTISYMAPEIFRGQAYNNTVDIYSIGLVLYQLLNNGRLPFLPKEGYCTAQDIDSANYMRLQETPLPSLDGKVLGEERIDSQLDAVVRKACAVNSSDRYQTAKEFYDALILLETESKNSIGSETKQQNVLPPVKPLKSQQNKRRHPVRKNLLVAVVPLLIIVVSGLAILLSRDRFSPSANTSATTETEIASANDSTEIVEIPDPVLKKALQDALGIWNREITKADAVSLTSFVCDGSESNQKIKKITGLSSFKNLTELNLEDNQIGDINELSGLTKLTKLSVSGNQLTDISALSGLTNLTELSLSFNHLHDISALYSLTNLKYLNIISNQLSDISTLSSLTNLTELYMATNQINDISSLSGMTKLRYLSFDRNHVRDISALSGLKELERLDLSTNQISDINTLSGLTDLWYLNLSDNHLTDISALTNLTDLSYLYLSNNQVSDINTLSGLLDLKALDLKYNQVSDINALSDLTNLQKLWLQGNPVLEIKSREEIMNVLSGAENLKEVDF